MRIIVALGALVAVLTLAGCGSSAAAGPQDTIQAWTDAIVAHDWQAACDLETVEYQGVDCYATYNTNVSAMSAMAGEDVAADIVLDPASCGLDEATGEYACAASGEYVGTILVVAQEVDGEWRIVRTG